MVMVTVLAMAMPFFNEMLALLGAIGFWPLGVYFPVEMYIAQVYFSVDNSVSLLHKAKDLVFSFEAATKATKPCNPPLIVDQSPSRWSPPPLHFFKLNFSVLLDKSHGTIRLGCLVRDHLGRVAAACSEPVPQPLDPTLL